jgi:hypothetical protein
VGYAYKKNYKMEEKWPPISEEAKGMLALIMQHRGIHEELLTSGFRHLGSLLLFKKSSQTHLFQSPRNQNGYLVRFSARDWYMVAKKTTSKKRSSSSSKEKKADLIMRMKATAMEIDGVGANGIEFEVHNKGKVSGRFYSGTQYDTVSGRMFPNGAGEFTVKFVQMTNKGETIVGQGTGTQDAPDKKGKARFRGQVTTWTGAARLGSINGAAWNFEGIRSLPNETAEIRATLTQQAGSQMQLQAQEGSNSEEGRAGSSSGGSSNNLHESM